MVTEGGKGTSSFPGLGLLKGCSLVEPGQERGDQAKMGASQWENALGVQTSLLLGGTAPLPECSPARRSMQLQAVAALFCRHWPKAKSTIVPLPLLSSHYPSSLQTSGPGTLHSPPPLNPTQPNHLNSPA